MKENSIILFSQGDITHWRGLPKDFLIEELIRLFDDPSKTDEVTLGYYPAQKYDFTVDGIKEGLTAYVRQQKVVLIETKQLPPTGTLDKLPEPDATLPNEILIDEAYAAEYVFCERGLNLTVAKHFDEIIPDKIVRCRGFEKISKPEEFDTRYYKSFEDSMLW